MKGLPRAIYRPNGAALEYAELACNLFTGCPHGCKYCFAPAALRKSREEFAGRVRPRERILEAMERDCRRLKKKEVKSGQATPEILLCFTCDPWPEVRELQDVTIKALRIIGYYGLRATTLTKGVPMESPFGMYRAYGHRYGISLSFLSPELRDEWEPHTLPPSGRVTVLSYAHIDKVATWVSVEPVVDAAEALRAIVAAAPHTDEFRLGKLNHMPEVEERIDWRDYGMRAVALCERLGKRYFVKKALARYLDPR